MQPSAPPPTPSWKLHAWKQTHHPWLKALFFFPPQKGKTSTSKVTLEHRREKYPLAAQCSPGQAALHKSPAHAVSDRAVLLPFLFHLPLPDSWAQGSSTPGPEVRTYPTLQTHPGHYWSGAVSKSTRSRVINCKKNIFKNEYWDDSLVAWLKLL